MSRYEVGDAATLTTVITVNGQPTDATVVLTVTRPDETTFTPDVQHVGTGSYLSTFALTQLGSWRHSWVATGGATSSDSGTFEVRPVARLLAQVEDVEDEMGTTFASAADRRKVRARLIGVSADVIGATGQKFFRGQRTIVVPGDLDDTIVLPQRPVVSVDAVALDGVPLAAGDDYRVVGSTIYRSFGRPWGYPGQWTDVTITYTAGYEVVPDDIVSLCARRVATQLGIPSGVRQYSIGSFSATVSTEQMGGGWSVQDQAVLARYSRRNRVGLLRLGDS